MKKLWEIIKSITIIKLLITKLITIKPFIAIRNIFISRKQNKQNSFIFGIFISILLIITVIIILVASFIAIQSIYALSEYNQKYNPLFLMIYHFKIDSQLKLLAKILYDNLLFNPFLIFLAIFITTITIFVIKNKKDLFSKNIPNKILVKNIILIPIKNLFFLTKEFYLKCLRANKYNDTKDFLKVIIFWLFSTYCLVSIVAELGPLPREFPRLMVFAIPSIIHFFLFVIVFLPILFYLKCLKAKKYNSIKGLFKVIVFWFIISLIIFWFIIIFWFTPFPLTEFLQQSVFSLILVITLLSFVSLYIIMLLYFLYLSIILNILNQITFLITTLISTARSNFNFAIKILFSTITIFIFLLMCGIVSYSSFNQKSSKLTINNNN